MTAEAPTRVDRARPPLWRDLRVLRVVIQVVALGLVGVVIYVLWYNLTNNLRRQGIRTDFGFLDQPMGVSIVGSDLSPGASIQRALLVGVRNTFALAAVGLPLLTAIGVLVGVARLSTNWLLSRLAAIYVELFRNLPPLLIIIFAFRAVILRLPPPRDPATPLDLFVVSNLRITVPGFVAGPNASTFGLIMLGALVTAVATWLWRTRVQETTGRHHHRVVYALVVLIAVGVIAFGALDSPIGLTIPTVDGRVVSGGFSGLGAYFAVMGALSLYTASHVAEIVRGSILAVPRGQTEAADALALRPFQRLRFVTLPQAMRIAIPPIINQYLNYVKNTSLAIAVAFAEVTVIAQQSIGNGQPAPQMIILLMAAYLAFSLPISLLVNVLNRRLQLATR